MSGGITRTEISMWIDLLREKGVAHFKCSEFELLLGAEPPRGVDTPEEKASKSNQIGSDGLTASEQLEMYGRIIDAKE